MTHGRHGTFGHRHNGSTYDPRHYKADRTMGGGSPHIEDSEKDRSRHWVLLIGTWSLIIVWVLLY